MNWYLESPLLLLGLLLGLTLLAVPALAWWARLARAATESLRTRLQALRSRLHRSIREWLLEEPHESDRL